MTDAQDLASVAEDPRRQRMVNAAWAVYERRAHVAYSQARPSQLLRHGLPLRVAARLITRADCSGLVALACDRARIRMGVDWRWTNTWTQLALFSEEVRLAGALPGDLVFYGPRPYDPHHVAILLRQRLSDYVREGVFDPEPRVLTNGHHPMSVEPIDYRPDRIHIRSLLA